MNCANMKPILVAAAVLVSVTVSAATFSEWQFRQEFQAPGPGIVKFSLPADTIEASRLDLAALRLADAAGNEVPYLIERPAPTGKVVVPATSFHVELGQGSTSITLQTGLKQALGGVTLVTPSTSFIKAVSVAGSNDGTTWQTLASGRPIFRQPNGASQLWVALPAGAWASLRLTVDDRASPPVPFTGAEVEAAAAELAPTEPVPVQMVERAEGPGETRLVLNLGAAHLRLASLEIETPDSLFRRQITIAVRQVEENTVREKTLASGPIYRVAVAGQPALAQLSLPLDVLVPTREVLVVIQNGDSPPLQISGVRVQRRPVYLLFLAPKPGGYELFSGNALCGAPRYDLASQGIGLETSPLAPLKLGAVATNPAYRAPETLPQVKDTGAALDVSAWRFRKPVKVERPGAQQLDLDLEVLAHAQPDLADLRLLRDGRQLPFIIEKTSVSRALKPESTRADDPRRPKFSRWSLKVSLANLPLTRLSCTSSTTLFRRQVALCEEATDERGTEYRRDLGSGSWVQSPDRVTNTLTLVLQAKPITDTLFLEMNNEDNPPVELANFEFTWPVTRLFFKTAVAQNVSLFYGNPAVASPQYDLSLVAGQLLAADKRVAMLGAEEQLKKTSWAELQRPGQGGWLLWGVLAVMVIALLVLIARLIPKQTPPAS
jgi:hypothetical protein